MNKIKEREIEKEGILTKDISEIESTSSDILHEIDTIDLHGTKYILKISQNVKNKTYKPLITACFIPNEIEWTFDVEELNQLLSHIKNLINAKKNSFKEEKITKEIKGTDMGPGGINNG